ncbi:MAG TPA: ZIP family metal transporter [Rugosimonospora sp.]|nr:ZIP family metal transporter [Rugosimonospora sp.]
MSGSRIALLGAIAGVTIFLGLPMGRVRSRTPTLKAWLNAVATGILIFLVWDVLSAAWDPIASAASDHRVGALLGNGLVLAAGVAAGLLGLVYFDQWVARRAKARVAPPGVVGDRGDPVATLTPVNTATEMAMLIAVGIGLHNFGEGLAIGNSAANGALSLAVLLVIGFGLHNATEGFGIVAPLSAAGDRPSWRYLGLLGLIGGGPTFVGTLVGQRFSSATVSIAFLALAAGSILYVVIELLAVARRFGLKGITTWGILVGLLLGFATDAVVTAAGA